MYAAHSTPCVQTHRLIFCLESFNSPLLPSVALRISPSPSFPLLPLSSPLPPPPLLFPQLETSFNFLKIQKVECTTKTVNNPPPDHSIQCDMSSSLPLAGVPPQSRAAATKVPSGQEGLCRSSWSDHGTAKERFPCHSSRVSKTYFTPSPHSLPSLPPQNVDADTVHSGVSERGHDKTARLPPECHGAPRPHLPPRLHHLLRLPLRLLRRPRQRGGDVGKPLLISPPNLCHTLTLSLGST